MSNKWLQYIQGELFLGEHPLHTLVQNYRHPIYVYDLKLIKNRLEQMQKALPSVKIFFAMKSNPNIQILSSLKQHGACVDVVSGGEIARAMQAGFLAHDVVFSGVGKTVSEIEDALERNIYQINVESVPELKRIAQVAAQKKVCASIALRLNPNVDIKTHPYIATGLHENKFGIELSQLGEVERILKQNSEGLSLKGISLHLGSQMKEFSGFREALHLLKAIYLELQQKFPSLDRFDVGGGLGVCYEQQDPEQEAIWLQAWAMAIQDELKDLNAEIQIEPGRFLVAHAGVLLAQVQYVKQTPYRKFIILDTGMNHLIRPSLYQAFHQILPLKENPERKKELVDIVGPICESADAFVKEYTFPVVEEFEFVAIADAGAYGFSMASQYNLQALPLEIVL